MRKCGWELVASDELSILPKLLLDAMVMKNSQSDGCLATSTGTDKGSGSKVFHQSNDLFNQLITSKTGPQCRWWWFTRYGGCKHKRLCSLEI